MNVNSDNITINNNELNLYEILEINDKSSKEDIKKSWKKLALKYHPDKCKNSSNDKFLKVKYAYDILSNDKLKKQYDEQLALHCKFDIMFKNGINIFDFNFKNYLTNFVSTSEINKIMKLMLHKKEILSSLLNPFNDIFECFNFNEFIKKLTDINIVINYDLKDIWRCIPKNVKYLRHTCDVFEEIIYPIDFIQIYENEGEQLIINNVLYKGNLTVQINIINTNINNEIYYVYNNELYVLINSDRIKKNKFKLNFLDGNNYKFDITKLNKITNELGTVYSKKNFGLPKISLNNITNKKSNDDNKISIMELETNIQHSNLFFIILLY